MHFLLPRSSVPLFDVEHGVGEKEWRGGKTRTGVKKDGERRGTGVARGEQHYLINTNPGSKLFRKASNNLLSLACGMHQTAEPIRSDQIRSNHLWGCFTHEHTHRHAHRSKGRPLMVALTFLSILHFWAMFTWPRGMRSHEAGKRGEINTNSLIQHVGRFCVFGYVFFHVHCFLTYEQTKCQASAVHANFYIEL